jgi:hypothetical protein
MQPRFMWQQRINNFKNTGFGYVSLHKQIKISVNNQSSIFCCSSPCR